MTQSDIYMPSWASRAIMRPWSKASICWKSHRAKNPTGNPHRYDDMIGLPRPVSRFHPPMARSKRAAQFAPFDALTGFGEAIREAERETEEKKELSEDEIEMMDVRLAVIGQHIKEQPSVAVTYFVPDTKKTGGRYVTVSGKVKMLDGVERVMMLSDGTRIPIGDVRYIEGKLFDAYEQY